MDVFLQRIGAEGIHRSPLTAAAWNDMADRAAAWHAEELAAAMALVMGASSSSSSAALSTEVKAARRLVTQTVEKSHKVFGTLYSALPDELRAQVEHIAQGWAYGLWHWLETKFQSTEEDAVGDLLEQWTSLRMDDSESFDAYRARVNKLRELLKAAKESPSDRMYTLIMLDRLQPRFKQAVLALKAGGQLKDADKIAWDTVTAFINSHERNESRMDASSDGIATAAAMAAAATRPPRQPRSNSSRDLSNVQCYECDQFGHLKMNCPNVAVNAKKGAQRGASTGRGGSSQSSMRTPREVASSAQTQRNQNGSTKTNSDAGSDSDDGREGSYAFAATAVFRRQCKILPRNTNASDESKQISKVKQASETRGVLAGSALITLVAEVSSTRSSSDSVRGLSADSRSLRGQSAEVKKDRSTNSWIEVGSASDTRVKKSQLGPGGSTFVVPCRQAYAVLQHDRESEDHERQVAYGSSMIPARRPSSLAAPAAAAASSAASRSPAAASASSSAAAAAQPSERPRPSAPSPPMREAPAADAKQRKGAAVGMNPDKALANYAWGVDSMASLHISGNKDLFAGMKRCAPISVQMADGGIVTTQHCGSIKLRVTTKGGRVVGIPIANVYYHERFSANLLSWNVLRGEGWEFHSTKDETYVETPGGNQVKLSTKGRVSVIDSAAPERVYAVDGELATPNVDTLVRLHERLGHITFERMIKLIKGGSTLDVKKLNATEHELRDAMQRIKECKACTRGKGMRTPDGHRGLDRGQARGEALHMDTYQVQLEHEGRTWLEYGLTVTDGYTQFRWFAKLASKDLVARAVIDIVRHARTQLDCRVKRLHADGGTEFINETLKSFCREEGIGLTYSPARTQQLNGIAENAVRSNKDAARTFLMHAKTPMRWWSYAAFHATFVWNRVHVAKRTNLTPYESMFGKKPSCKHWGVFGCDAFYHVPKEQRTAFGSKMEPCVYLGHNGIQNCASIYILRTRKIICTRDVTYRSGSFHHAAAVRVGGDAVEAILRDEPPPPSAPEIDAHGGHEQDDGITSDDDESEANADQDREYDIDAIVGHRQFRGRKQYRVRWIGYDEETWEPESMLNEDAPDIVEDYLASLPPPRQSPRHVQFDDEAEPQVHMAMCAISGMHSNEDRIHRDHSNMVCAVKAGIAMLEKQTPQTYRAAIESPHGAEWKRSMDKEMGSCAAHEVWELVPRADLPRGTNILPPKWVYKVKTDETGEVVERKSRITPKGFKQKEGQDYFEVFARTGMYKTKRVGLSLAAKWDHELDQLDVPTAFLNADVDELVYMELPEGYRDGKEHLVCRLRKSLYGLKQAPRNWYILVSKFITDELGFKATVSDPCMFFRRSRTGRLMLLFLFVDDFQVSYHIDDLDEWNALKQLLVARFRTKDMGPSKWILGMRITRNRRARTITLDQELYITKALEKYGLADCKIAATPEVVGAAHQEPSAQQNEPADKQRYMEITGTIMYAAISTRLDIAHAAHYLASHMLAPTKLHMAAAERVLRYLAGTKEVGLVFGSRNSGAVGDSRGRAAAVQVDVCAYADADWANNKGDRRSVTGWVAKLNGDPVSWASKKQRTVALSTCEAELYAEAEAIKEALWMRGLAKELGLATQVGSMIYGDNQSAIALSKNGVKGERTKHVDVKYHFVTETVGRGDVQLKWIPTNEQQADIFTKALPQPAFELLRKQLMTQ